MKIRDRITDFRRVKASELLPNPKNWRTHPTEQADAMRGVLAEVGIADALLVRETPHGLQIVDGHLRADVDAEVEWPVLVLDVNDAEADMLLATHDPLAAMAGTDAELLSSLLDDIETSNAALQEMLDGMADDAGLIEPPEIEEDEPPEPPADPVTKPGDLWILGDHRVLCGDATNAEDVTRLMDGAKVEMVWSDPPYGVDYAGGSKPRESIENDAVDDLEAFIDSALSLAGTVCEPGGAWFIAAPPGPQFLDFAVVLKRLGVWRQTLAWIKNNSTFSPTGQRFHYRHEAVFFGWWPGAAHISNGDRTLDTVWEYDRPSRSDDHPTEKPVKLVAEQMLSCIAKTVYDPFLGSGTTLIAAEQLNRRCFGMEISCQYSDVICQRWATLTDRQPILERTGETFAQVMERLYAKA